MSFHSSSLSKDVSLFDLKQLFLNIENEPVPLVVVLVPTAIAPLPLAFVAVAAPVARAAAGFRGGKTARFLVVVTGYWC